MLGDESATGILADRVQAEPFGLEPAGEMGDATQVGVPGASGVASPTQVNAVLRDERFKDAAR